MGEYKVNLPYRFGFNFLHLKKFLPAECLLTTSNFYCLSFSESVWRFLVNQYKILSKIHMEWSMPRELAWMLCSDGSHRHEWMEPLGSRLTAEGKAIQRTAASSLPALSVPAAHPLPQALVPSPKERLVPAAFMVFSQSKSSEDKRLLCWRLVPHRVTTVLNVLKNTLLLFISITAFAKWLPSLLGGTRVNTV